MSAPFEAERYELFEEPRYCFPLSRREFIGAAGGGLLVLCLLEDAEAQERGRGGAPTQDLAAWIHIAEDGAVTAHTGKAEMGQGIRTSLSQVVADELRVPLPSVRMVMGDTDLTPYDMGTFGSRTTPSMMPQLARAAATAREALLDLAAAEWKEDRATLVAAEGRVTHPPSGRALGYGALTKGKKLVKTVGVGGTPPSPGELAGAPTARVSGRDLVTGRHRFASDIARPGMLHGKVLRAPSFGATMESVDAADAEAPGLTVVRDGGFVGIAAATERQAAEALKRIKTAWKESPQVSDKELFAELKKTAGAGRPQSQGSVEKGLAESEVKLERSYTIAYIAHAPLEPRAAVAEWSDGRLTVWTGTQRPFGVRGELARAFGIPEGRVRVIVPDTGAAFGGKHSGEAAVEAARLAKAAGRPVKLVWTREEEFTWAYFRPAGLIDVKSGARKDGTLLAWEFHNYNSGGSAIQTPYDVPNRKIESHGSRSPLRQGSYRALASTANTFARESHMDELAHACGLDPLAFRLKNLKDARLRAVLEAAAERFGWGREKGGGGRGFGLACGTEKGGFMATCAEIRVEADGTVRIIRVVNAFDGGAVVNPEGLKAQIEGCVIMGIGGALYEAIRFEKGRILNPAFSSYRVPRLADTPSMETVLVDRKDAAPAGAGESPIIAIAPALGSALFEATGSRRRSLPLVEMA